MSDNISMAIERKRLDNGEWEEVIGNIPLEETKWARGVVDDRNKDNGQYRLVEIWETRHVVYSGS